MSGGVENLNKCVCVALEGSVPVCLSGLMCLLSLSGDPAGVGIERFRGVFMALPCVSGRFLGLFGVF